MAVGQGGVEDVGLVGVRAVLVIERVQVWVGRCIGRVLGLAV
ncbi:MAG: hypothetical protein QOF86_1606, partial [Baekduia sp.]|nr:hypothetical protein [Baekduia sp.]